MYSLKKRVLSVFSALLGLILSLGAIVAVVFAVKDMLKEVPVFSIGKSLQKLNIDFGIISSTIQWCFIVAVLLIAIINLLLCIKLIKKPMEIDEKYQNFGVKKVFFAIFTLVLGLITPMQLFNEDILAGEMLLTYIVIGVAGLIVLLQIISMFVCAYKKEKKTNIEKDETTVEITEPCVCEKNATISEQNVVALDGNARKMFNSIANDPILDGFENRVREIKHLRDAGLINDQQASAAVENIIDDFLK